MRQYGAFRATSITKKQINVIYGKAKRGELKVEKWFIESLYDLADYYGYDYNRSVEERETFTRMILNAIFANETERAQELINLETDRVYSLKGQKNKEKCDRNVFVA